VVQGNGEWRLEAGVNPRFVINRLVPEALKSVERHRMACAVWGRGPGFVVGHNRRILWPAGDSNAGTGPFTIHAEEHALSRWNAGRSESRFAIPPIRALVIRVTMAGRLALARPCGKCMRMFLRAGVKDVSWTLPGGNFCTMELQ
jgi:hypothetical protein